MSSDRIIERTKLLLGQYVANINGCVLDEDGFAEVVLPGSHRPVLVPESDIPGLIRKTTNILQAQSFHARHAPHWTIPLPVGDEIPPLLQSRSGPLCLLGHFSYSLMLMRYDYAAHPSISTFGCGAMAHPATPGYIRDDAELRCEFPPRELPGLSAGLIWSGADLPHRVRVGVLSS